MLHWIAKLVFKVLGWKLEGEIPEEVKKKCVIIAAPHTSNWDFPIAISALILMKVKIRYAIKKEVMRFPVKWIFRNLGAIPIDRSPKKGSTKRQSMVELMTNLFTQYNELAIIIPAEGTRSKVENWKTGFYYVALNAKVPLALGYMDYKRKRAGVGKVIYPTGNIEKDMSEIMAFYQDIPGKYPEKFSLDVRFPPLK